jgi:hypothetical protein
MGFESAVSLQSNVPRERGFIDLIEFGVCGWLLKCKPSDLVLDFVTSGHEVS